MLVHTNTKQNSKGTGVTVRVRAAKLHHLCGILSVPEVRRVPKSSAVQFLYKIRVMPNQHQAKPGLVLVSSWLLKIVLMLGVWLIPILILATLPDILILHSPSNAQSANAQHLPGSSSSQAITTPTPQCTPTWNIVQNSPNPSTTDNFLFGMEAVSASDVWAVGLYSGNGRGRTLALHWNGVEWTHVPSPSPGTETSYFYGISAISSNDVWAVGHAHNTGDAWWSLTAHWDGAQWTVLPTPDPEPDPYPRVDYLYGVAAISTNDVWAVGYYLNIYGYRRTLIYHWNGVQWSIVPSPNVGSFSNGLEAVSAVSANDVWAVGYTDGGGGTLTMHWDGVEWSVVPSPSPPDAHGVGLRGVAAIAGNDVWAVGGYSSAPGVGGTVIEHWDGVQWSIVSSPDADMMVNTRQLYAVSASASNDVWAVGYYCCGPDGLTTLIEHWDGVQWTVVPSPNRGTNNNYLRAVAATSTNDVRAVGYWDTCLNCPKLTLIEHYALPDSCLPTPTPTTTPTPIPSPTNIPTTAITPRSTHTSTPTPTLTLTPGTGSTLVGHVNWEARPAQPSALQTLSVTLTLSSGPTNRTFTNLSTDQYGFFSATLGNLPSAIYTWQVDDAASQTHPPNYLANTGEVDIGGTPTISVEMGIMRAGDANNDDMVNIADFNMLKVAFGTACGSANYDRRTDFTGDCLVNTADFAPLKRNFGQGGAPPVGPGIP